MTQACDLTKKHCVPCEGGMPPLTEKEYVSLLKETPQWSVVDQNAIERNFSFQNFSSALAFIDHIGEIAEKEGHHPDIFLHDWNKVRLTLSTHAIHGLSENDFILASKIDEFLESSKK